MMKKMMMIKRLYIAIALVALNIMPMQAQTHAEATSQKWKGIDVTTVLDNNDYPDDNKMTSGYPIILYNVGTGCFVTQGGDWAMEGRLFYSSFGRTMYLYKTGRINSGLTEGGVEVQKNSFCVRPPYPFGKKWSNWRSYNLTTLMDGNQKQYGLKWRFERVEDSSDTDSYTYYMSMKFNNNDTIYYLGAAYGEWWAEKYYNRETGEYEGKEKGKFSSLDDDRCCWTTEDVRGNTTKKQLKNGDQVEIQKLYQWKLISVTEFLDVLTQENVGLNPSISALIPDRDFTRNSDDFFDWDYNPYNQWFVSRLANHIYGDSQRYAYTCADYRQQYNEKGKTQWDSNQQAIPERFIDEAWDSPVKLKAVFDRRYTKAERGTVYDDLYFGMKNAKNGFLPFEGVGTLYTNFKVTKAGWYEIECGGFSMSQQDHDAYMFARVIPDADNATTPNAASLESEFPVGDQDSPHYGKVTLQKLNFGTYQKNTTIAVRDVGEELRKHRDSYKKAVWVLVSQEDIDAGRSTIRVGIGKDAATRSDLMTYSYGGTTRTGYYDTDWVCIDDIRSSYMGTGPAFFYEDMETLDYLDDVNHIALFNQHEFAKGGEAGRYGGATALQRKFTTNAWNTFSFPLPLTGEQVRNAFGDSSELLEFNSIGGLSRNDCIIDFKTVNLVTLDEVVTPGKLYMLKPSQDPTYGENPRGKMNYYYDLGKMFFSTKAEDNNNGYTHPVIDLSIWGESENASSYKSKNDGAGHVTYIQTPSYSKFRVNSSGEVIRTSRNGTDLGIVDDTYAPKGSYVMSGGMMYELSRDTPIKGFRGWITTTHSIFPDEEAAAAGAKFAIDGVIDGEDPIATSIDQHLAQPVNVRAIAGVYDIMGRKISNSVENLPKGLYIIGGKKLLIK